MDDIENPYQSPSSDEPDSAAKSSDWDEGDDPRTIGKARHVPTVAMLMMVHGVLLILAAFGLIGVMIFVTPQIGEQIEKQQEMQQRQNPNAPQLSKDGMTTLLYGVYGGMSVVLFIIGALGIYAGLRNHGYNNRILGVVSLVLNMGSILFCYCLPLSLGLLIFGLIIYLSPEAERAFRWKSENATA